MGEDSVFLGVEVLPGVVYPFGVNDQGSLGQEFIGHISSGLEIPSAVSLEVKDQFLHSCPYQRLERIMKLFMSGGGKIVQPDVPDLRGDHVRNIEAVGGDHVTRNSIILQARSTAAENADLDFRSPGPFELAHDLFIGDLLPGYQGVIDLYDPVTRPDPDLF